MPARASLVKATVAWKALLAGCARRRFEPHDIAAQLDDNAHAIAVAFIADIGNSF
jgi:hypothetical protein